VDLTELAEGIAEVVRYNWASEIRDFEECLAGSGNENGILATLYKLACWSRMDEEVAEYEKLMATRRTCRHCGQALAPTAHGTWQAADGSGAEACDLSGNGGPGHEPEDEDLP
jgi:hypothetical protein